MVFPQNVDTTVLFGLAVRSGLEKETTDTDILGTNRIECI